ncbi:hypothetical protein JEOAER750_01627 [Jeotgalicoccus aerolatus]|uniref:Uncharacterized protein YoxC n=1 Tax=Jeotgalicoccus aerolatus TaxID=709510 RepID=A0ABS4HKF4_9STAP|nr:hypothetical protein [Jeotgalicoccus aerolatus]MBP1951313.1 uncharacterized protein YoxC [Jeotgalicoccus aerolatus]NMA80810.1 hypothetical protein [Jeotgalicoccus aerolatus]GGD98470.1 hypothetical protein GCM10007273_08650 [Jeotgalicoccus aerolatus]CAD2077194.1 hypothetical protein JEOAER750_01627 [Jeotgalicoccus aerolatus]
MAEVNWKKAYHDLENHIEAIMRETSELVNNASPKLRLNDVLIEKTNTLDVVIDATGDTMEYAIDLIDRKGKIETIKTGYQKANAFSFDIPAGRYTITAYAKESLKDNSRVFEKIQVNFKKDVK